MRYWKHLVFLLLFFLPVLLCAQSGFDLTGRASIRVQSLDYDETSDIKPDSIDANTYGKSIAIPGLQQMLNLSLFGRTKDFDLTLLADVKSNKWDTFDFQDLNSISRLTLNIRTPNHELIIGDFFESSTETFIQSREIRGGKYSANLPGITGKNSYLSINALGGMVQRAVPTGERLLGLYKQYETSGQFRRLMASGGATLGQRGLYDLSLHYLWGADQDASVDTSLNDPLKNNVYGSKGNVYLWNRNIRLFGEFFRSEKDTINKNKGTDQTYNGGIDLRYEALKVIFLYQYLGFNYFTTGYPYLENDKKGIKGQAAYAFPKVISLFSDFELYDDNLEKNLFLPTTETNIFNIGLTTLFTGLPELTLRYGIRDDNSNLVTDEEDFEFKTDKLTTKIEGQIGFKINRTRLSLTLINLDLEDKSLLGAASPLGTKQLISSFNLYSRATSNLFISGGAVYSGLELTNGQKNVNMYLYETTRWDILRRKLKFENTITFIHNDASNGGTQDVISDYYLINGEISLEYFFSDQVSLKVIAGTDSRKYRYTVNEALKIISDPDFGPTYFNSSESYTGLLIGGEFNWIF